jgi:hypothetical protein
MAGPIWSPWTLSPCPKGIYEPQLDQQVPNLSDLGVTGIILFISAFSSFLQFFSFSKMFYVLPVKTLIL